MRTLPLVDAVYPLLLEPTIVQLEEVHVCREYNPASGIKNVEWQTYRNVSVIVLVPDQLYVLPEAYHDLRCGQYLVCNTFVQEELELDEPLFMLYDDLGDFITGSRHGQNKYTFVKVPDLQKMGRFARTVVLQSYAGPIQPETALEVESFVLAHAAVIDPDLREALDRLYLMISDLDTRGRTTLRRKTLMGNAVEAQVDEALATVADSNLLIESRIAVALNRQDQILDRLTQLQSVIKNRLDSKIDATRLLNYAVELESEAQLLRAIVDRPFVNVVAHLRREMLNAALSFRRYATNKNHDYLAAATDELHTSNRVLEFILLIYPRIFDFRLDLADLVDYNQPMTDAERGDYLVEAEEIIHLARRHDCDKWLQGAKLAAPVLDLLEDARGNIGARNATGAYRAIKRGTKRAA